MERQLFRSNLRAGFFVSLKTLWQAWQAFLNCSLRKQLINLSFGQRSLIAGPRSIGQKFFLPWPPCKRNFVSFDPFSDDRIMSNFCPRAIETLAYRLIYLHLSMNVSCSDGPPCDRTVSSNPKCSTFVFYSRPMSSIASCTMIDGPGLSSFLTIFCWDGLFDSLRFFDVRLRLLVDLILNITAEQSFVYRRIRQRRL